MILEFYDSQVSGEKAHYYGEKYLLQKLIP